jgi:hypothetical protein
MSVLGVPGMRFLEGSDAASYERRQLQIEGKTFLEAFESCVVAVRLPRLKAPKVNRPLVA